MGNTKKLARLDGDTIYLGNLVKVADVFGEKAEEADSVEPAAPELFIQSNAASSSLVVDNFEDITNAARESAQHFKRLFTD